MAHPSDRRAAVRRSTEMLSRKARYALRAILFLASREADGRPVLAAEIAASARVPRKFLETILAELRDHGIVMSRRGRHGGYRLAKPAGRISFGDVMRIADGPLAPIRCASRTGYRPCADCADVSSCDIRHAMLKARDALASVLDRCTLADALERGAAPRPLTVSP